MTIVRIGVAAMLALLSLEPAAATVEDYAAPYRTLREANRTLDAALATSVYAPDGALIFDIPGQPRESHRGADAIRAAYDRTFAQVDPGTAIGIEFRFAGNGPGPGHHSGAYRLTARIGGRDIVNYGRFTVKLVRQDGSWRIAEDIGTLATAEDFDALPRPARGADGPDPVHQAMDR